MDTFTIITLSALIGGAITAIVAEASIVADLYAGSSAPVSPRKHAADGR
jgi:hypothetical protein